MSSKSAKLILSITCTSSTLELANEGLGPE